MKYKIYSDNPHNHFLTIEMVVENITSDRIKIQLPAWRPGRYELQNFAKNIQQFEVVDTFNQAVNFYKVSKDRWKIATKGLSSVIIKFRYFAFLPSANGVHANAGSSYLDDQTMYINFINCLPYVSGRIVEPHQVSIEMPENFQIACGLQREGNTLLANDYYELVDSPMLASPYLQKDGYKVGDTDFTVWFLGDYQPNWEKIKADFEQFSAHQIALMGDFPEKEYHFINWIMPNACYHGVEHRNSTMITLGPASEGDGLYADLLGVSSHELFHAWNICKIRPQEMMPYDLTQENYFETGFVVEGVTTYFGDLFLAQSGVFSATAYIKELGAVLKRHFEQDGRAVQSLLESSYDLWLDGYTPSIPDRRVSIYQKGALVALLLDLTIRLKHQHQKSLNDVMKLMWERYGKTGIGYTLGDYRTVCELVYGDSLKAYFDECIAGASPLENMTAALLSEVGLDLQITPEGKYHVELIDAENENLKRWLNL